MHGAVYGGHFEHVRVAETLKSNKWLVYTYISKHINRVQLYMHIESEFIHIDYYPFLLNDFEIDLERLNLNHRINIGI